MHLALGCAVAHDLAGIIDGGGIFEHESGSGGDELVEVAHLPAAINKCVIDEELSVAVNGGAAHDLAGAVDGISDEIAAVRIDREAESVFLEVRDEDKGISPERLNEIQSQGSGVGIKGMRERVRQFGGDMNIDSNGGGTTVSATLPATKHASSKLHISDQQVQAAR